jgi:DNA-binding response OmpR family regulator
VMDDDPAIQLLFERYSLKHHPIKAETHEEAAHLLQTTHPTALILDCEYDPAILKTILTVADPSLSIIQVPLPSGRRTLRKLGLADYLVKPVSREMLTAAVAQCGKEAHRILIIDDDADIVRLFALILGTLPFVDEIWQAYGGLEGLEIMKQQRPDVVILDLLMPDLDGFSILEAVKADPDLCDLPLILVSAQGAGDAIRSSVNGAISFSKPAGFQPIELVRCIEALVDTVNPTTASQAP